MFTDIYSIIHDEQEDAWYVSMRVQKALLMFSASKTKMKP